MWLFGVFQVSIEERLCIARETKALSEGSPFGVMLWVEAVEKSTQLWLNIIITMPGYDLWFRLQW